MFVSRVLVSLVLASVLATSVAAQDNPKPKKAKRAAGQVQRTAEKHEVQTARGVFGKALDGRLIVLGPAVARPDVQLLPLLLGRGMGVDANPSLRSRTVRSLLVSELQAARARLLVASGNLARTRTLEAIKKATDALELATIELRRVVWKLKREKAASATKKK